MAYAFGMTEKRKRGRPRKKIREINPVRQVGRWSDDDWQIIRDAAESAEVDVATWAKSVLIPAAKRQLRRARSSTRKPGGKE